jgi:spermidine synthase
MQPWQTLDRVETAEGRLELRQRGQRDFLITIGGRVLMTSAAHRSEEALAQLTCEALPKEAKHQSKGAARTKGRKEPAPRLLLGGLGMGFTLRAALDRLPASAEVAVVDLHSCVVDWCRGPLAALTDRAVEDRRVTLHVGDVARFIQQPGAGSYDAILLDLYEGPHHATRHAAQGLYGAAALTRWHSALRKGGVLAVWSEEADTAFESRFAAAGFGVEKHREGRGGRAHVIYLGKARERAGAPGRPTPR